MIQGVDFLDKNGNSSFGAALPMYNDIFLYIESDNLGTGLNFRVKLTNQDTNQYYNLKLYPKIGSTIVNTYLSTLLRYLSNLNSYSLYIEILEYNDDIYSSSASVQIDVYPRIYNSFLPKISDYYYYYYTASDFDTLSKVDPIAWYNDSYVVLTDQVAINSSLKNIYKKVGTVYEKHIRIHHKQVCEPLWKIQYLNLHTGDYDRFSGWYLKQDTKQVSRQTYNRLVVGDTGMRQSLVNLDDEFTLISYDLPVEQANYIAKSIIMSPKTYLIDTNETQVECVVQDNSYQDAVSVVNTFSNIKLKIKI
jgi:hypothetical protein